VKKLEEQEKVLQVENNDLKEKTTGLEEKV